MSILFSVIFFVFILHSLLASTEGFVMNYYNSIFYNQTDQHNSLQCNLDLRLIKEIRNYQPIIYSIINRVTKGDFKGLVYEELSNFTDKFGSRQSGTENLEKSINYTMDLLRHYNLENVHGEPCMIPVWIRGKEYAEMITPRNHSLNMLGLGGSISTPPDGITAEALVVNSFDELHERAAEAVGKIIVFNQDYVSYGETVVYRSKGAVEAAKVGGIASLIRSVTAFSLYTPHTGQQGYDKNVKEIPTACITVEDAQMLRRISERGEKIIIHLYMEAHQQQMKMSRNTVGELVGYQEQKKIVLVSGHIDSWDVGQGAMDDGAGAFVSWFSVALLKNLKLQPKRTIRAVLWTAEEQGLIGVQQYIKDHFNELENFDIVMESDEGTFTPEGIEFAGTDSAACIMQEIGKLLTPLNMRKFKVRDSVSSDITMITKYGVPGATLLNKNDRYTWYHHTNADTMTSLDSNDLDKNVAAYAAIAYVIADLSIEIPRENSIF
ncbi:carboxypeptidase Q-like [Lycorma delicatula]|uniref:carboxypeptidase Q-like n=1 Tax=Lycorma delicatula TaxID=130591 RepID=UPI003F515CC2